VINLSGPIRDAEALPPMAQVGAFVRERMLEELLAGEVLEVWVVDPALVLSRRLWRGRRVRAATRRVQGWFVDVGPENGGETYQGVSCLTCNQLHMVNPRTGHVLGGFRRRAETRAMPRDGISDSNSEMSQQIIPLKGRADFLP
jgi:hypothetical protein